VRPTKPAPAAFLESCRGSDKRGRLQLTPRHPDSRRISIGNFQYLATAANAFDHAVKRRVLAIDWIVWITEALLVGHLIGPRLAVANRCLRQQLLVSVRRWRWCGWISRTNRLRNRRRSVDQGQQRYRRDQLSHDGSSESGASHDSVVAGRLDHKVPKSHVTFRCSKRAGAPKSQKQFSHSRRPEPAAAFPESCGGNGLRSRASLCPNACPKGHKTKPG